MGIDIYLPAKIKMKRVIPRRHYTGTLEMGGHKLGYSLEYDEPDKKGMQKSRLIWVDYRDDFSEIYTTLDNDIMDFLHRKIIDIEARINIMHKKFPGNLGLQSAGGTPAIVEKENKQEYSMKIPSEEVENLQMEFDTNIKLSGNLEKILRTSKS